MQLLRNGLLSAPLALASLAAAEIPDAWSGTFAEARQAGDRDGKLILLFFPPSRLADAPSFILDAAAARRAGEKYHLARARAEDLKDLLVELGVKKVPAVFLLDCHGEILERWEGVLPPDLWAQADRAARRAKAAEEEAARALAESRAALDRGDHAAALAAARKVRSAARPGSPPTQGAAEVEAAVVARGGEEIRKAMALDGLIPDSALVEVLGRLRAAFPHPALEEAVEREIARIRTRPIGGTR